MLAHCSTRQRFGLRAPLRRFGIRLHSKNIEKVITATQHDPMPLRQTPWPHAPTHQLGEQGVYFVTASTYQKEHHFRGPERLAVLHRGLLIVARDFAWKLEAWAVFSNHYHFIARSPESEDNADSLSRMLSLLHTKTARWVNQLDHATGRQVWQNFRETKLTYQRSYLARLNYVHQNAVKHGLAPVANLYPWCSAAWFEENAAPGTVKAVYRFKTDALHVEDAFEAAEDW